MKVDQKNLNIKIIKYLIIYLKSFNIKIYYEKSLKCEYFEIMLNFNS